jgi:hypothetical protein
MTFSLVVASLISELTGLAGSTGRVAPARC